MRIVQHYLNSKIMQKKKFNLVESVQKYLDETPKEQIQKDIEEVTNLKCEGDTADEYFEKVNTLFSDFIVGVDVSSSEQDKTYVFVFRDNNGTIEWMQNIENDSPEELQKYVEELTKKYPMNDWKPTFEFKKTTKEETLRNTLINRFLLEYNKEFQKEMLRFKW